MVDRSQARNIEEAYRMLDPFALVKPGDPWYVDLDRLVPLKHYSTAYKLKKLLEDQRGEFAQVALIGHRGVGKTTLVHGTLAKLSVRPIEINALEVFDRTDFVFSDLMLAIAEAVFRKLVEMGAKLEGRNLDLVRRWFTEEVITETHANQLKASLDTSVEAGTSIPFLAAFAAKLVATLRTDNEYRRELRLRTKHDPGELVRRVNLLLDSAHETFTTDGARLCIVIDGLEKFEATELVDRAVLVRAADIRNLRANVIFFFNPANEYSPHSTSVRKAFPCVTMPVLPVRFPGDGPDVVRPEVVQAIEQLLSRRVVLDAIFDDPTACIERLAHWSGGHISDLLEIARRAVELYESPYRATVADIDEAGRALGIRLTSTMKPEDLPRAVAIYHEHRILDTEHDRRLLKNSCVLPYDSVDWWDIHPGIRADPFFLNAVRRATPHDQE